MLIPFNGVRDTRIAMDYNLAKTISWNRVIRLDIALIWFTLVG
jgi:hypothetical protein